jgi:hypothetical protein
MNIKRILGNVALFAVNGAAMSVINNCFGFESAILIGLAMIISKIEFIK